ncbi:hypothetical protein KL86PLE_130170 [uncultured Pleomorphomonas sp.]|uniref:Uncharacterized protein n=1 Tax=uncultured Pleomorphomonas sp. TaxID=442121 RepID=A0A212L9V1_9HYPH|nr:hypothetical protein KL86PLE_130170 [uncultured Pleomorphomonas sp.]
MQIDETRGKKCRRPLRKKCRFPGRYSAEALVRLPRRLKQYVSDRNIWQDSLKSRRRKTRRFPDRRA